MSQRVNISVPDELHQRIQEVKDQINVSAICSEALDSAVSVQESISKAQGDREKMVERLKAGRIKAENWWLQAGRTEGIEAAKDTSYEGFVLIDAAVDAADSNPYLNHWSQDLWEHDEFAWIEDSAENQMVPKPFRTDFYIGIFEALLEQWDAVREGVMG